MNAIPKIPIPMRMTVAEFIAWGGTDDERRWELVDGVPTEMAPASNIHASILAQLGFLIQSALLAGQRQGAVLMTPGVAPRLRPESNLRIPDLAVSSSIAQRGTYAVPDPILIAEILSPSNEQATWTNIWAYTTIPSLTEILAVNSAEVGARLIRRDSAGAWPESPIGLGAADTVELHSVGARFPLAALYVGTELA